MSFIKNVFSRKDKNKENQKISEISGPTNVIQNIHVGVDPLTGKIVVG